MEKKLFIYLLFFLFLFPNFLVANVSTAWVVRENGSGNNNDVACGVVVDGYGNVYVTGYSVGSTGGFNYLTIKYDSDGNKIWEGYFNGTGNGDDFARAIAIDNQGNIYVTGSSWSSGLNWNDIVTIKYDNAGNPIWVRTYNSGTRRLDYAEAITVDNQGNVYVTGYTFSILSSYDCIILKYDSNGNLLWARTYDNSGGDDQALAVVVDNQGNVYVAGHTNEDILLIKYNSNGTLQWVSVWYNEEGADRATAMAVDNQGNIYVTGHLENSEPNYFDYFTIKYASNGEILWYKSYDGPSSDYYDFAAAITLDGQGGVYVTGESEGDIATIKYDANSGNELWIRRYLNGIGKVMGKDNNGNIYVSGSSNNNYLTIKYDPNGNQIWSKIYNGGDYEEPFGTAVYKEDVVIVTGHSDYDYLTIKYEPSHDVGIVDILYPIGEIPLNAQVIPQVKVENYGPYTENFKAYFKIEYGNSVSYLDSTDLTLEPETTAIINFSPYNVTNLGTHNTSTWILLSNDSVPDNNQLVGSFECVYRDIGVEAIVFPVGEVNLGSVVVPRVRYRNNGSLGSVFKAYFRMEHDEGVSYLDSIEVMIPAGGVTEVDFSSYYLVDTGVYYTYAWLVFDGDQNPDNNQLAGSFECVYYDAALLDILAPRGIINTLTIKPRVSLKNNSNRVVNIPVYFHIIYNDNTVYADTQVVENVDIGGIVEVTFDEFVFNEADTGKVYYTEAKTLLENDQFVDNDEKRGSFLVRVERGPADFGWIRERSVSGVSKAVKSGGALCALGKRVYVLVGGNTREMAVYDIEGRIWVGVETLPGSRWTTRPKGVKKGSAICTDGRYIYVIKGGNTKEFWRYDPVGDTWHELDTVPFSKGIRGGSMAYDGSNYIYIISGSNNNWWVRFNINDSRFEPCEPPYLPPAFDAKWKIGSWVVYVSESSAIYALRAGVRNKNEFWMIKVDGSGRYEEKKGMPVIAYSGGRRKFAKEGSAGAYASEFGYIYALKGGNTREFFAYSPGLDTWYTLDTIPSEKRVKGGGSLTYSSYARGLFAVPGNNLYEFWFYRPYLKLFARRGSAGDGVRAKGEVLGDFSLKVIPVNNRYKISYSSSQGNLAELRVYDIVGNLIYTSISRDGYFMIDSKRFSKGIYILRLHIDKHQITKKLIIR